MRSGESCGRGKSCLKLELQLARAWGPSIESCRLFAANVNANWLIDFMCEILPEKQNIFKGYPQKSNLIEIEA